MTVFVAVPNAELAVDSVADCVEFSAPVALPVALPSAPVTPLRLLPLSDRLPDPDALAIGVDTLPDPFKLALLDVTAEPAVPTAPLAVDSALLVMPFVFVSAVPAACVTVPVTADVLGVEPLSVPFALLPRLP